MHCHECARGMIEEVAVGHCRFCLVGLCKNHLVDSFRGPSSHAVHASTVPSWRMQIAQISMAEAALVLASPAVASRIPGRFRHWLGDRPSPTKEPVGS